MHHLDFIILGVLAFVFGLVSKSIQRTPLTLPIVAVTVGIFIGPFGADISHLHAESETVRLLAELTLALVLFYDASRIDLSRLRTHLSLPVRLLGPGLVATVLLGFGLGVLILGGDSASGPGLGLWQIALLAALLAPTDAALGQAVVSQKSVPLDERTALNVESGLNDGLIVPVVAALMACSVGASHSDSTAFTWLGHGAVAIGFGVGPGIIIGWIAAKLLDLAFTRDWMEEGPSRVAVAAVPVGAFFGAEMIGGSGFLAAFVAGIVAGAAVRSLPSSAFEYTENTAETMGIVTWTVFGVTAAPAALECATPPVILYALLSLTVVRMLPVALALLGTGLPVSSKLFLGWFGPRGLASVVFAVAVLGEAEIEGAEQIFGVAVWTVLLSVLLHGLTAGWLARKYGASRAASL